MRKGVGEERCGRDEEERERERSTRQDGLDGVYLLSGHREYITSSTVVPLPHNNLYGLALYVVHKAFYVEIYCCRLYSSAT